MVLVAGCTGMKGMPDQVGHDGVAGQGEEPAGDDKVVTFTCSFAGDPGSKVSVSDQGKNCWEPGDQILVHGEGKDNRKTVTLTASDISDDGKVATISVSGVTPYDRYSDKGYISTYYASYPASAVSSGNLYYYGRFTNTNAPLMSAYDDTKGHFKFYNLCGLVTFKVSGDFDRYEFSGNGGETVGYSFFQTYLVLKKDGTPRLTFNYTDDNGTNGPLTTIGGTVTGDGSTVHYIGLPAGACLNEGFTLNLFKNGRVVKILKTSSKYDIARNKLLPLGDITARLEDAPPADPEAERLARLGRTPIVAVYFTEYTKDKDFPSLEEVRCFTHINIGHARFVNPKTGDGGLVVKDPGCSA